MRMKSGKYIDLEFNHRPPAFALIAQMKRWQWGFQKRWIRLVRRRYGIEKRMGHLWLLDQKSVVDRSLIIKKFWEPRQLEMLFQLVKKHQPEQGKSAFLDVGAHIGTYSILMNSTNRFDEVFAFEAEPTTAAQLTSNIFLNDLVGQFNLVQAAASDKEGTLMFSAGPENNRGAARAMSMNPSWKATVSEVKSVRVDSIVKLQGGFIAAKIDVEGGEFAVLDGMGSLLTDNDGVLQIECFAGSETKLFDYMEKLKFSCVGSIDVDYYFVKAR